MQTRFFFFKQCTHYMNTYSLNAAKSLLTVPLISRKRWHEEDFCSVFNSKGFTERDVFTDCFSACYFILGMTDFFFPLCF